MEITEKRIRSIRTRLRPIEEEIFEVLYDLSSEREKDNRVKMKEILDLVGHDHLSKAQLTNIIRRKLEEMELNVEGNEMERVQLVDYLPYEGVLLTDTGHAIAKVIKRNHRLAEVLLGNILGMDWSMVHDQACHMEHSLTENMAESILAKTGPDPLTPYGFPVPSGSPEREKFEFNDVNLHGAPLDKTLVLQRVIPTPELLQKLKTANVSGLKGKFKKMSEDETQITLLNLVTGTKLDLDITAGHRLFVTVE
ncbi:MAG: metal-dependent transcriptional regulator [Candidatus Hodarchaeales archaeon]